MNRAQGQLIVGVAIVLLAILFAAMQYDAIALVLGVVGLIVTGTAVEDRR